MNIRAVLSLVLWAGTLGAGSALAAGQFEYYNSSQILGIDNEPIAEPAYTEVWVDGGDEIISPLGSGDDEPVPGAIGFFFSDGYFYEAFPVSELGLTEADKIFVRLFDATGEYYMDGASLLSLMNSAPPNPPPMFDFSEGNSHTWIAIGESSNQPPASNQAPQTAVYVSSYTGTVPIEIVFNTANSTDADGTIVLTEVDTESDGTYDLSIVGTGIVTGYYDTAGSYTATIRCTDDDGATDLATASLELTDAVTTELVITLAGIVSGQEIRGIVTITAAVSPADTADSMRIEYRRVGSPRWTTLPYQRNGDEYQARLFANSLSRGAQYDVRAVATSEGISFESEQVTVLVAGVASPWGARFPGAGYRPGPRRIR